MQKRKIRKKIWNSMKQKRIYNKLKKITGDFAFNIVASLVSTGMMQLIIYPRLAITFDSTFYGAILTAMGLINTISLSLGNTLNNARLIQEEHYDIRGVKGDFNVLLSVGEIIGVCAILIASGIVFEFSFIVDICIGVEVLLLIARSYLLVAYRLKINYRKNLICNVIIAFGYALGLGINSVLGIWPVVFICGELAGIIYLSFSGLLKEPFKITELFRSTLGKYIILILTSFSGNILLYLDRILLYPLLGGEAVSIYTVASFMGKTLGVVMTPISGVLLSYYAQKNFVMNQKRFWTINTVTFLLAVFFLIIVTPISPYFTGMLYPTLIEEAKPYLFVANLAAILSVVCNMVQPSIIKFVPIYWQIIKEVIYGVSYIILSLLLFKKYGIYGFCIAAVISNLFKLLVLCMVGTLYFGKKQRAV